MQKNKIQILSTKILLPSIVEQAKQSNITIDAQEFISIQPVSSKKTDDEVMAVVLNKAVSNVVFTSANAVDAVQKYLRRGDTWYLPNWDIFCLSGKTKDHIKTHLSDRRIIATAENGATLAQKIVSAGIKEAVLFCGNKRRHELPGILNKNAIKLKEIIVYENVEIPKVAKKNYNGIIFFSPSAVSSFFSANHLQKETVCFAIGQTTAKAIEDYTASKIITSESPTQEMMLASINFYFENINCY